MRSPREARLGPQTRERRQAGPPAALDENVENPLDESENSRRTPQEEAFAVRWLIERHGLRTCVARVLAAELGLGGAP